MIADGEIADGNLTSLWVSWGNFVGGAGLVGCIQIGHEDDGATHCLLRGWD